MAAMTTDSVMTATICMRFDVRSNMLSADDVLVGGEAVGTVAGAASGIGGEMGDDDDDVATKSSNGTPTI